MAPTPEPAVARNVVEALRDRVTAATLTPFDASGAVRLEAVPGYAAALARGGAGALAVCVHTGRGPWLPDAQRAALVSAFATASGLPVVAGAGVPRGSADPVAAVIRDAEPVVAAGASALLCFPPPRMPADAVVDLHVRLAAATGVPVLAFALYEQAGGHLYDAATAARLMCAPGVAGIKLALLDDAIACQDMIAACLHANPSALVITGEDRMLGPSLMWGARGMLVGLAAALPAWSVAVNDAWLHGRYDEFVSASARLDRLASLVFRAPMDGYVQRMAWVAEWEGSLDPAFCHDPFGPAVRPGERDELLHALDSMAVAR
jgi:4-hydroxy-tetrahydrodipicolinate synthase